MNNVSNDIANYLAAGGKIQQIPIGVGEGVKTSALLGGERLTKAHRERLKRKQKAMPLGKNLTMDIGRRESNEKQ